MNRIRALVAFAALSLSACATWTVPNETVDVLPQGKWAAGAGLGMTPATSTRQQNFPAQNGSKSTATFFASGRAGLGSDWEVDLEASYIFAALSATPRIRKQWLDQDLSGARVSSVAAGGLFYARANESDFESYNGVTSVYERMSGAMLSNSVGVLWPNGFQAYAGPRLNWMHWSADYGASPNKTLTWNGFVPGGFAGLAYHWVTESKLGIQLNLMGSFMLVPTNLTTANTALWPGACLTVQLMPN